MRNDRWREIVHQTPLLQGRTYKHTMYQTHELEYRYEERDDMFSLKCWHDGNETSIRGNLGAWPEWLKPILDMAVVGGHLKRIHSPPPDAVLWFTTDLNNNLNTFLELT